MQSYTLYNDDVACANFVYANGLIREYRPTMPALLPMQIRSCGAEAFMLWLDTRSIDLNVFQHRNMVKQLLGSRDKLTLALRTNMFSISDTFTCFPDGEFIPRDQLCSPEDQEAFSAYILLSSDTSIRQARPVTPNVSTDGSFTKTWKYEKDGWWLYKLQPSNATRSEVEISKVLRRIGWAAAVYEYIGAYRTRVRSKNFVGKGEFFEPYDSFRFMFKDTSDDDVVIMANLTSLGDAFRRDWKRILAADAFFMNTDRHMRNFGVIRSSKTGDVLRLAPNFDNNQAYTANPGGFSANMLRLFVRSADAEDRENLKLLAGTCEGSKYLAAACQAYASLC